MQPKNQNLEKQPSESASHAAENPEPMEAVIEKPADKTREEAKKKLRIEKDKE